ncbi:extensin family protein [Tianweitania sp. BSSL-BM11]|uniref:Extensin family protein n=1 Tax=Tianweitania aestuarii TaxID=2814886 RepID=A0ABS5RXK4_9HYPH|nr:extensin family protein [Tianweitania aestuarii]MBS9721036.1 extensin family protein [Tianweitania aestuarii]
MTSSLRNNLRTAILFGVVMAAMPSFGFAQTQDEQPELPRTMQAPQANPEEEPPSQTEPAEQPSSPKTEQDQELPASPPKPQANPEEPAAASEDKDVPGEPRSSDEPEQPQALPAAPPEPETRPEDAPKTEKPDDTAKKEEDAPAQKRANGPRPEQGPPLPKSLVGAEPESERACRAELKTLGVVFEDRGPESDENGCSMPYPVSVSNFGGGIKVEPAVVANCAVSLTMAKFLQTKVREAAKKHLKTDVTAMANGSGYVCRPRHGTQKLSEHALGNAIDIMSFTFADGRSVVVEKTTDKAEADFLAEVRAAACGPFTTVLGPGSDADHANHFHLDLADRKPGVTFCQ